MECCGVRSKDVVCVEQSVVVEGWQEVFETAVYSKPRDEQYVRLEKPISSSAWSHLVSSRATRV
jgi:hypothetical protein